MSNFTAGKTHLGQLSENECRLEQVMKESPGMMGQFHVLIWIMVMYANTHTFLTLLRNIY